MIRIFLIYCSVLLTGHLTAADNLPGMAAGLLAQPNLARQAVAQHDRAAALDHLHLASTLASDIERQAPPARPIIVPITQDIDRTTTYTPVKRGKSGQVTEYRLKKHT